MFVKEKTVDNFGDDAWYALDGQKKGKTRNWLLESCL